LKVAELATKPLGFSHWVKHTAIAAWGQQTTVLIDNSKADGAR
jgi:hypothetical protein